MIKPAGSKLWRFDYAFQGKRNTLSLGAYPKTPLAAARKVRDELKALLKQGTDPSYQRKLTRHVQALSTFQRLDEAVDHKTNFVNLLGVEPFFHPLRSDPRFTRILKRLNLSE